ARKSDFIARLGGDEFVLLLEGVDREDVCTRLATEFLAVLDQPLALNDTLSVSVGASIGIAFGETGAVSAEAIIAQADEAMYRAKEQGRHRYCIHRPSAHERGPRPQPGHPFWEEGHPWPDIPPPSSPHPAATQLQFHLRHRQWATEQIALGFVATQSPERGQLDRGLDALGEGGEAEAAGYADHRLDDGAVVVVEGGDEGLIDLESVHPQPLEIAE